MIAGRLSTVRSRLFALTAILVLAYGVLSVSWIVGNYRSERETLLQGLANAASAHSLTIDRTIDQSEALLRGLATSPYLQSGDLARFYDQVQHVRPDAGAWIVLQTTDGGQLLNSDFPFGTALPGNPNRPTWLAIQGNERFVSNVTGGFTGRGPLVFVTVPIYRDGVLAYGLSFMITPDFFHRRVYQDGLPKSWTGGVIDREGRIITRRDDVRGRSGEMSSLDLAALDKMSHGSIDMTTPDGVPVFATFVRSPSTGWSMIVSVPRDHLANSIRKSLLLLLAVTIGVLAVGLIVASLVARSIAGPVESLARYAAQLGDGQWIDGPHTTLRETASVAARMQQTSKLLDEQRAALRALNQDLESRVAERTRELEAAQESLVQAHKLEALGQLTGGMAHDFNNLLMAILGNLSLLRRRLGDETHAQFIDNAAAAANRGAHLVGQLLAFSRRQQLTPEPVDVNAVMASMENLLRSTLGGTIAVTTALRDALSPAMADRTQLELVVLNLAINARDAMPMGGSLMIETRHERIERRARRQEEPEPGDYVVIMVSDNGIGMSPHVLEHALDPFFTTKEVGKGSGLGLSQVLGVMKQLGGGMRIESAEGRGTTVHLFLPRSAAPAGQAGEVETRDRRAALAGLRVLLVDDDPDVRLITAELLGELGCTVRDAASGYAALDLLAESEERFDLVLLDYAMPAMSGLEVAERIGRSHPDLPILIMTGYEAGFDHTWSGEMLHKPFSEEDLADRIVKLCGPRNIVPFARSA